MANALDSPSIAVLVSAKTKKFRVERFLLPKNQEKTWNIYNETRFYLFLDARGSLSIEALGAKWKQHLESNTIIIIPEGIEHTIRNSGDAALRAIIFSTNRGEGYASEKQPQKTKSAFIRDLYSCPQRNMVSFFSRSLYTAQDSQIEAIQLIEHQAILPGGWVPAHTHKDREEIGYLIRGNGSLRLENKEIEIDAGEAFWIPSGMKHSMTNKKDEVIEYAIMQISKE